MHEGKKLLNPGNYFFSKFWPLLFPSPVRVFLRLMYYVQLLSIRAGQQDQAFVNLRVLVILLFAHGLPLVGRHQRKG